MRANLTTYRGYCIDVFGKGASWRYSASPRTPDLPILNHNVFALDAETKGLALADARLRIDCLLRMV
jgi:hypothetical protein